MFLSIYRVPCTSERPKVEETTPVIKAYLNPYCPWSSGVRTVLDRAGLQYEELDITKDRKALAEMVAKSRQYASPCVEIDGVMLADVGGAEVEAWLRQRGLLC